MVITLLLSFIAVLVDGILYNLEVGNLAYMIKRYGVMRVGQILV